MATTGTAVFRRDASGATMGTAAVMLVAAEVRRATRHNHGIEGARRTTVRRGDCNSHPRRGHNDGGKAEYINGGKTEYAIPPAPPVDHFGQTRSRHAQNLTPNQLHTA